MKNQGSPRLFKSKSHYDHLWIKIASPVSLSALYIWITVVAPFLRNGVPPGWDTWAYIAWVKSFVLGGFSYVQNPTFIQYSGANLSPLLLLYGTFLLTRSELFGYVIFQLVILAAFFVSTFMLSRGFNRSVFYTSIVFFFLITSSAFIQMTSDLYANLLAISFLQIALVGLIWARNGHDRIGGLLVYVFSTLMLVTDIEIGLFGIFVVVVSVVIFSLREQLTPIRILWSLRPVLAAVVTGAILWLPYAQAFFPSSTAVAPPSTNLDWNGIESGLGGPLLLPIWMVGVAWVLYELKRNRSNDRTSILLSWFLVFLVSLVLTLTFRPTLANRVALLLPIYFLVPEALTLFHGTYFRIKLASNYAKPISLLVILSGATVISLYSVSFLAIQANPQANSPYLSRDQYQTLSSVANYLQLKNISGASAIFLVYPSQRTFDPQNVNVWTNLYDNWIFATVGPHLTYYGTVANFTDHVHMTFVSPNEENTFRTYSNQFASVAPHHSVDLVVVPFLCGGPQSDLTGLQQPIRNVYVEKIP